jgi:hypothetical protein
MRLLFTMDKKGRVSLRLCLIQLKCLKNLPGDVNARIAAEVFVRTFTFKVILAGIDMSFFPFLVCFYVVCICHDRPPIILM